MKTNKTNSFRTELDHYLEEDVLPDNSQFDILLWWKLNGVKYPILQTIARDISDFSIYCCFRVCI